jgi:hypothetical protein
MPLPVITNVYRCGLHWRSTSTPQSAANVIHVRDEGGTRTTTEVGNLVISTIAGRLTNSLLTVPVSWVVDLVRVTPLDGVGSSVEIPTDDITGAGPGTDWVPAASTVVSLYTGLRGRSGRGRIYLPACTETSITDGLLAVGTTDSIRTGWESIMTDFNNYDPSLPLVVASYRHATAEPVTSIRVRSGVGTQRNRQERVRALAG